jgi:hypothetical protein
MAADMSGEQMQAKITAARREAEGLKDKIKRRKDELADTSRTTSPFSLRPLHLRQELSANNEIPMQSVRSRRTKPMLYHELA